MRKLVIVLFVPLMGCASIMHGSRQNVGISSSPSGALARTEKGLSCYTPCVLKLPRSHSHTILLEKEGYEPGGVTVANSTSGWVWGNLFFGGLIGLGVDLASGGFWKLEPNTVNASLSKK